MRSQKAIRLHIMTNAREFVFLRRSDSDSVRLHTHDETTWSKPATIVRDSGPGSYLVDTGGGVLRRNRKHVHAVPSKSDADDECEEQSKPEPVIKPVQDIPKQHVEPDPALNLQLESCGCQRVTMTIVAGTLRGL